MPSYWDNAASYNLASVLSSLLHPHLLTTPVNFGTQTSPCKATHVGFLRDLPPHLAFAFWGPGFKYNLYSLGYLQRQGGSYSSTKLPPNQQPRLRVFDDKGNLIDLSILSSSNLYPANPHIPRPQPNPPSLQLPQQKHTPSILHLHFPGPTLQSKHFTTSTTTLVTPPLQQASNLDPFRPMSPLMISSPTERPTDHASHASKASSATDPTHHSPFLARPTVRSV